MRILLALVLTLAGCCPDLMHEHELKCHEWHYVIVGDEYWIFDRHNQLMVIIARELVDR